MKKTLCIIISLLLIFCTSCSNECNCNCNCNCNCISTTPVVQNDNRESSNETEEDSLSSPDTTSDSVEEESLSTSDTTSDSAYSVEEDDSESIEEDYEAEEREEKRLYKKAKKMYLSGEWDGTKPIKVGSRTISRDENYGDILIDDYQVNSCQECIDLPESFDQDKSNSRTEYIPNQGVYVIEDRTLVKYVRGEKITLKGGPLKWKGLDPQNKGKYSCIAEDEMIHGFPYIRTMYLSNCIPYLYYDKKANQLIMVTTNPLKACQYLYIFPDYNVSQIKYLEKISEFTVWYDGTEDTFYYRDMEGTTWMYTKNGPKKIPKEKSVFY